MVTKKLISSVKSLNLTIYVTIMTYKNDNENFGKE